MSTHIFVDESKARTLLVAAAVISADKVSGHRKTMRGLLLPGQRRVHFKKESPARQRKVISAVSEFGLTVRLYRADKDDIVGRKGCLAAVVRDAAGSAERLIIERDESTLEFDRKLLYAATREHDCADSLHDALMAPHAELKALQTRETRLTNRPDGCRVHFQELVPLTNTMMPRDEQAVKLIPGPVRGARWKRCHRMSHQGVADGPERRSAH